MEKKSRPTYHHKNLKDEIILETLNYIGEKGFETLSLREISSRIGVAHTAIYHYYKNKQDLLADVATIQFQNFVNDVKQKNTKLLHEPYAQLFSYGNLYIQYALHHGNIFKLMLGKQPFDLVRYPDLIKVSGGALQYLVDLVKKCQEAGIVKKGDPLQISLGIWSITHGYAMLLLDNRIETLGIYGFSPDFSTTQLTDFIFDFLKNGLLIDTKKFY
ncbi:MAG: TetR/AcrR family transcriptional regulator [Spirochaetia bacterium]|nr:TetR/AcrR family transcriptional regulator [Spirochaetia bacterium]